MSLPYMPKPSRFRWNPRYEIYAASHGRTPEAQLAWDRVLGAAMLEFSIWIQRQWSVRRSEDHGVGKHRFDPAEGTGIGADIFDRWLFDRILAEVDDAARGDGVQSPSTHGGRVPHSIQGQSDQDR